MDESPVTGPREQPELHPPPDPGDTLPAYQEIDSGVRRSSAIPEPPHEPVTDNRDVDAAPGAGTDDESVPDAQATIPDRMPDEVVAEPPKKEADPVVVVRSEEPQAPAIPAQKPKAPPPAARNGVRPIIIAGAIAAIVLLLIAAILFMPPSDTHLEGNEPVTTPPTTVPVTTLTKEPVVTQPPVPQEGVFVRIISPAYYSGEAGNPEYLQQFSGSGEKLVRMLNDDGLVQVSVKKQDYTIEELLVEVYRNGTLVTARSTTAPAGSVVLLIDPATGNPPGLPTAGTTNPAGTGQLTYH
jgi:hypothetical protein